MKTKSLMVVVWSFVVIGCVIAGIIIVNRPPAPEVVKQPQPLTTPLPSPAATQSLPQNMASQMDSAPSTPTAITETAETITNAQIQKTIAQAAVPQPNQSSSGNNQIQDPLARVALAAVGDDSNADDYWVTAINNPDLPSDERRELIEDLNQDGFADTKNLTAEDLPLIVNRLQLIEELAPNAMDDVNAAAFQEAYKDLINMYSKLTQN